MVDGKENYKFDLGVIGLTNLPCQYFRKLITNRIKNMLTHVEMLRVDAFQTSTKCL